MSSTTRPSGGSSIRASASNRYLESSTSTTALRSIQPDWGKLERLNTADQEIKTKKPRRPEAGGSSSSTALADITDTLINSEQIRYYGSKAQIHVVRRPIGILTPDHVGGIDPFLAGEFGIDYADPEFEKNILLPLIVYDDETFAFRKPAEWARYFPIKAHALRRDEGGEGWGVSI